MKGIIDDATCIYIFKYLQNERYRWCYIYVHDNHVSCICIHLYVYMYTSICKSIYIYIHNTMIITYQVRIYIIKETKYKWKYMIYCYDSIHTHENVYNMCIPTFMYIYIFIYTHSKSFKVNIVFYHILSYHWNLNQYERIWNTCVYIYIVRMSVCTYRSI